MASRCVVPSSFKRSATATGFPGRSLASSPLCSNTGGKFTDGLDGPGSLPPSVMLDWLRFTAKDERRDLIADVVSEYFGPVVETTRTGLFFCKTVWKWASGVCLYFGHADGVVVLECPGKALGTMSTERVHQFGRTVMCLLGVKMTRLDVALDFDDGSGRELVRQVEQSCEAGELIGNSRWGPIRTYQGRNLKGETMNVGSRSAGGAERVLRVYDKGLEQRMLNAKPGDWVRWEAEFTADRANELACRIFGDDEADWRAVASASAVGCFQFRVRTGDKNATRRPWAAWYAKLIELCGFVRVRLGRRARAAAGAVSWACKSVFPFVERMIRELGGTYEQAKYWCSGGEDLMPAVLRAGSGQAALVAEIRGWEGGSWSSAPGGR